MRPIRAIPPLILLTLALAACSTSPAPAPAAAPASSLAAPVLRPLEPMPFQRQASPGESRGRLALEVGHLRADRGSAHARVTVRNTASHDLAKVTVECVAFDGVRAPRAVAHRTVVSPADGPLAPGMARTVDLALEAGAEELGSMTCEAHAL